MSVPLRRNTFRCQLCNHPPFGSPSSLQQHMTTMHKKSYECYTCKATFTTTLSLATHK
jgi:predicted SprT family Zn-dependent metalloprotease